MPNDDQQGGILSIIGRGISQVLPYALPAALGAAMGGPMGALAGVAASQPDPSQQLERQKLGLEVRQEAMSEHAMQMEQQAQQSLYSDPGFQQFVQQNLGIDPQHMQKLSGIPIKDLNPLLTTAIKLRTAGTKLGPITQQPDGSWAAMNLVTHEMIPMGKPTAAVSAELRAKTAEEGITAADARAIANRAAAESREQESIAAAAERQEKSIAAADTRAETPRPKAIPIYNVKDPSRTKMVSAGPGYEPPEGWTMSRPRTTKTWTAADALNAVTKADALVTKDLTRPGMIYGSTPPSLEMRRRARAHQLLSEGLDINGYPLKPGTKISMP